MKTKLAWHIYHNILVEPLTEPLKRRIKYIRLHKPKEEIEMRLRLLKLVKGDLPTEIIEADEACLEADKVWLEAYKACREAGEAWREAGEAWREIYKACLEADKTWREAYKACLEAGEKNKDLIETLHREECPDCPWNGNSILS